MRVPVLYLYGEDSKYRAVAEMNARRFEEHNPNIEVISFQGGIHDLHLQYPHEVSSVVLKFLEPQSDKGVVAGVVTVPGIGERSDPDEAIY
jgi:pimeloyl-ACP methyl ester carboxylesterase